jgi:sulfotransferase
LNESPRFHFISGLPRSGSTLLAAILRQNPRFHAGMTSGLGSLVAANLQVMSAGSEVSLMMEEAQRPAILKGLFTSYYAPQVDKDIISTPTACDAHARRDQRGSAAQVIAPRPAASPAEAPPA